MPVKVEICTKVLTACWAHALSTEVEEVMGILMGNMDTQEELLRLSCLIPIRRTTKQKDRVEIDGNDLVTASMEAEKLGLRVLGWYHSHPHITVHPSHVDLRTQLNYQAMDKNFVGLIFSVFNYDGKNGQDNREVVVFQTDDVQDCGPQCRYLHLVPVISNHPEDSMISKFVHRSVSSVSRILMEEELAEEQRRFHILYNGSW